MQKILLLCYEYPPLGGGGGRVAAQVARALQQRGYELHVVTGGMNSLPKESMIDGIKVSRVRSGRRHEDSCTVFEMMLWVLAALPVALREAYRWKPDIIHAHFAVPTGALAWLLHQLTRIPYFLTVHLGDVPGGVPEQTAFLFKIIKPWTIPIWRAAAAVTAVSTFVADLAERAYGVRPEVILNGVDFFRTTSLSEPNLEKNLIAMPCESSVKLTKEENRPHLLIVGRLSIQKNPLFAIQALALLDDLPWSLHIVGEGPLSEALRAEVRQQNFQDRVLFRGWLEEKEVREVMQRSDILLMPSLSEGLPMAGVEALTCGLAIVGSHIGGLQDIVKDGKNGRFFNLNDGVQAMAEALRPFLENRALLRQAQEASRCLARGFEWSKSVDAYQKVITAVVQASQKHE